ncbi:TPA: phage tail protein [Yersinia enterocolitica]
MAWYRSGTVTSVAGQNVITGTGTQWANNVMGVAPGQAFIVQRANGNTLIYEILAVDSNTRIRINGNVVDALVASNYGIQTSVSNSYSALARETSAQLALYQQLLEDWQNITTGTGDVTIIAPDDTEVVIPALSWISDSKTWFDTNKELIENAWEAVDGALVNLGLGEGSLVPIGVPLPYPLATPPAGFLKCNGSSFSTAEYPKLALAYPSGVLPDLRGEFIRGWDDGRGVDAGRALLSAQSDLFKAHHHSFAFFTGYAAGGGTGAVYNYSGNAGRDTGDTGGNETRPRNIAFNYIVRAA